VWIAGGAVVAVWLWRQRPPPRHVAALAAAVAVSAGLLVATDWFRTGSFEDTALYDRLGRGVATGRDSPVATRAEEFRTAIASWRTAMWTGHGAGSANLLEQWVGTVPRIRAAGWIGNAILFVLHDAGLLGLLLWLAVPVAAVHEWRAARPALARTPLGGDHEALLVGLGAMLVAWQATHGLWQMYGYAYLGLLLALGHVARRPADAAPDGG
jgi:O-antigen ligase